MVRGARRTGLEVPVQLSARSSSASYPAGETAPASSSARALAIWSVGLG
ncbi:hypothetical protein JD78_01453 [Modestobacter roseus]|uniref:Uncharacterized protein n=1 Tax=Modestobacter roseus TaxID=1181884 RepID=A0A562IPW2_9ACTN|nr:hypothetical protein JD78_01453 [Modestobacter roseus]